MKVNKNIWVGKNKPYNRNSLYFPNGVNSGGTTPAPPSGGESSIEYLDVSGLGAINAYLRQILVQFADFVKIKTESSSGVGVSLDGMGMLFGGVDDTACVAIAIDFSRHVKGRSSVRELDASIFDLLTTETNISTAEQLDSIPRITKEQFYNLD